MTYNEVIDLSNRIDLNFLLEYANAVATKTQDIINHLIPKELNQAPDPEHLKKVLFEEYALNKNSAWVAEHYSYKTKGWFLGHLGLTHPRGHLGQIILLRKLFGLGSGE
jgi:3-isopropylmalate dehydratase small subunit